MDREDTRQCEYINPDKTCAIMMALSGETDPRCKLWRDKLEVCRYLKYHVLKGRGLYRGGRARKQQKGAEAQ
ncbi:hypothetical protein [Paenibacillus polysaccharolyticus]|uniref:hypothetical protein n=1 Tax=Paenibacillus polysaccharolyticus TaxID=582692 RepID=UPI0030094C01